MIQRVRAAGVAFAAVLCDELDGRSRWLRAQLDAAGLRYVAEVPADTPVYLRPPAFGVPAQALGTTGRAFPQPRVRAATSPIPASAGARGPETQFVALAVREAERGVLAGEFAARRVWTVREGQLAQAWLVIRRRVGSQGTAKRKLRYALSNAPKDTPAQGHAARAVGDVEGPALRHRVRQPRGQIGPGVG